MCAGFSFSEGEERGTLRRRDTIVSSSQGGSGPAVISLAAERGEG